VRTTPSAESALGQQRGNGLLLLAQPSFAVASHHLPSSAIIGATTLNARTASGNSIQRSAMSAKSAENPAKKRPAISQVSGGLSEVVIEL